MELPLQFPLKEAAARGCGCPSCQEPVWEPDCHGGDAEGGLLWGWWHCWHSLRDGSTLPAGSGSLAQGLPRLGTAQPRRYWDSSGRRSENRPTAPALLLPRASRPSLLSLSHVISPGPDGSCLQFSMFPHLRFHLAPAMTVKRASRHSCFYSFHKHEPGDGCHQAP